MNLPAISTNILRANRAYSPEIFVSSDSRPVVSWYPRPDSRQRTLYWARTKASAARLNRLAGALWCGICEQTYRTTTAREAAGGFVWGEGAPNRRPGVNASSRRLRDVRLCVSLDALDVRLPRARQTHYKPDSCVRRCAALRRVTEELGDGMAAASWENLRGRVPLYTSSDSWVLDNGAPNERPGVMARACRLVTVRARIVRYAGVRAMIQRATEYSLLRPFVRAAAARLRGMRFTANLVTV